MSNVDNYDPLFQEDDRSSVLPIRYPSIRNCLEKQRACYWQAHEVSLVGDLPDWEKLTSDEKYFIKMVLAFFATSDIIVNKNLTTRFTQEILVHEVSALYNYQKMMEDIHSEMYAILIDTYITDAVDKNYLFNAVKNIPIIAEKAAWADKWMKSELPYKLRLIAFSAMEGIFFSGSFCAIYWLKERGVLPGFTKSNDFISRDEGLHVESAVEIHKLLKDKATFAELKDIYTEAVELEIKFITNALPCNLLGMNANLMINYIKYVANRLSKQFGFEEIYPNCEQPFAFMDRIGLSGKNNFFENKSTDYSLEAAVEAEDPYADV